MTTVELANLALLKCGVSKAIADINESSQEAYAVKKCFDHLLRATLRAYPWSWATKYLVLTQTQGAPDSTDATVADNIQAWASGQIYAVGDVVIASGVIYVCTVAHTAATPTNNPPNTSFWSADSTDYPTQSNNDWAYAYRWPTDCLYARRIVPEGGRRQFSETPIEFRIGRDANGELIYTNQQDAELEYTVIDCDHLWTDDLFIKAFTTNLAEFLAPSLARDEKMAARLSAQFQMQIEFAATVNAREWQQPKSGDAEWINAR